VQEIGIVQLDIVAASLLLSIEFLSPACIEDIFKVGTAGLGV
jgi:hypothetical protein